MRYYIDIRDFVFCFGKCFGIMIQFFYSKLLSKCLQYQFTYMLFSFKMPLVVAELGQAPENNYKVKYYCLQASSIST